MDLIKTGKYIADKRKSLGLTQKQVAEKLGMSDKSVSKWERGFPIWWYVAPTIINTFLESYDFSGKTIVPFATSGGSGMGNTNEKLAPSCPGAILMKGKMLNGLLSQEELKAWVKSL